MNRFVVLRDEAYDMYGVDLAHPIESPLSKEDLSGEIRTFFDNLAEKGNLLLADYRVLWVQHLLDLGGTGLMIDYSDLARMEFTADRKSYYWDFRPPTILTADEWFARGPNP